MTFSPDSGANGRDRREASDPLAQFTGWKFDTNMPEAWRSLAETSVDQSREAYERAKATLEAGLQAVERSYDAAGRAVAALNRKIVDIAEQNIDSGFDLARNLATAKNLAELVELQGAYWRKQFETLLVQAEEVRSLSLRATREVAEPIARHASRQREAVEELSRKATAEATNAIRRQASELRRAS